MTTLLCVTKTVPVVPFPEKLVFVTLLAACVLAHLMLATKEGELTGKVNDERTNLGSPHFGAEIVTTETEQLEGDIEEWDGLEVSQSEWCWRDTVECKELESTPDSGSGS